MPQYTKKQAASLWITITCVGINDIDALWNNWQGFWNLTDKKDAVILTGTLVKTATAGVFQLRIGPTSGGAAWVTLTPGKYSLTYQIKNITADYDQETTDVLVIEKQRYV